MSCRVHDDWRFDLVCTCTAERKWAREKMLQESLEKLLTLRGTAK